MLRGCKLEVSGHSWRCLTPVHAAQVALTQHATLASGGVTVVARRSARHCTLPHTRARCPGGPSRSTRRWRRAA